MIRKIISIDEEKCDGCGLCVTACHEGAIAMAEGKARLPPRRLLRRPGGLPAGLPGRGDFLCAARKPPPMTKRPCRPIWHKKRHPIPRPANAPARRPGSCIPRPPARSPVCPRPQPTCASGPCRSSWPRCRPLTLPARTCSLPPTVPRMRMGISTGNL